MEFKLKKYLIKINSLHQAVEVYQMGRKKKEGAKGTKIKEGSKAIDENRYLILTSRKLDPKFHHQGKT